MLECRHDEIQLLRQMRWNQRNLSGSHTEDMLGNISSLGNIMVGQKDSRDFCFQ